MDVFTALTICGGATLGDVLIHALRCLPFRESLVMVECAGIRVETQVHVEGVGHVDLLLEGRLIVELDGRHHGEWAQVKKDQRRNNRSVLLGHAVLR